MSSTLVSLALLLLTSVIFSQAEPIKCPAQNHLGEKLYHLVHANCQKFYKCDHGKKYEYTCEDGLYFNVKLGICDYPEKVDCKPNEEVIVNCPKTNREAGRLVHLPHRECKKFYKCDHGEAIEFQCPIGEYFLPRLEVCGPGKITTHCSE